MLLALSPVVDLVLLVDDPERTAALTATYPALGIWFLVDLIWAITYTASPKKLTVSSP